MYSFRSFLLSESAKPSLALAFHTKIGGNKEGTIGHATHIADYSLHGRQLHQTALEMLDHINNNKRAHTDVTRKIDGAVSAATTKPEGEARKVSYKGGSSPQFKQRDVATVRNTWGPKGTNPKPHLAGLFSKLVQQKTRYPPGSWQFDALKLQGDHSHGGNITKYISAHGSHEGKETIDIPTKMHHDDTDIGDKSRAEIQEHINKSRKWSQNHTDKHLVDKDGKRHKFLTDGTKDYVEHYMNSTLDTNQEATSDGLRDHVHNQYEDKIAKLDPKKNVKAIEGLRKKQAEARKHIETNAQKFDRTFAIHREMQHAQNKLAVAIGTKSTKTRRFPFRMHVRHPTMGWIPSETGEGFMAEHKATGMKAKIVGRSANGTKVKIRHNFAWLNRNSGRF